MKRRTVYALAVLALSLMVSGCGFDLSQLPPLPPIPTATPTAAQEARSTAPPTAEPSKSPTTVPTPSPTVQACVQKTEYVFTPSFDPSASQWVNRVRTAEHDFMIKHPEKFHDHFFKFPDSQDVLFAGMIEYLATRGLDACVDLTGGDLLVSAHGMKTGAEGTRTEQFHPISSWDDEKQSGRMVAEAPFTGFYTPRYW